jgi:predicted transcriptional regulator
LEAAPTFVDIATFMTKGLTVKPAAEFVSPSVEYDFKLGKVLETEVYKEDVDVGLKMEHLTRGIMVAGGSHKERTATNLSIIFEASKLAWNYLIVDTKKEFRKLVNMNPETRVYPGKSICINPLDPEGSSVSEYISLLLRLFQVLWDLTNRQSIGLNEALRSIYEKQDGDGAPTLEDLRNALINQSSSKLRTPQERGEIEGLIRGVTGLVLSEESPTINGRSTVTFGELTTNPTVIEISKKDQIFSSFFKGLMIIKALATENGRYSIFLDDAEEIFKNVRFGWRTQQVYFQESLTGWVESLKDAKVGLHVSTSLPRLIYEPITPMIETRIFHKLVSSEDISVAGDLMGLEESAPGIHSLKRERLYQKTYFKYLKEGEALFQRPDLPTGFPIILQYPAGVSSKAPSDQEIRNRLEELYPPQNVNQAESLPSTMLERDLKNETENAVKILELLYEYPQLSLTNIMQSLKTEVDSEKLSYLVEKLKDQEYLKETLEIWKSRTKRVYSLTLKGEQAVKEYTESRR